MRRELPGPVKDPPGTEVTTDDVLQRLTLEGLSSATQYRRWITDLAEPWLGETPVEIGSGTGDYADEWRRTGRRLTVTERDPELVSALRERFTDDDVTVRSSSLPEDVPSSGAHTAAVAINVLEHIEDDVGAVRAMGAMCRPDGHVVVFVPAFPALMSRFDREVGHHRRYRRASLTACLDAAGLDVVLVHHVNLLGFLSWWGLMRLGRQRPTDGFALRVFESLVPTLRWLESRLHPPFGQSLFAVARRPEH